MAAPPSPSTDYFSTTATAGRGTRPPPAILPQRQRTGGATPGSPRTPLLGRSISSQFGSPGSFRAEQEELIIYELGARHLGAGFASESKPRYILRFEPEMGRRVGDYRQYDPQYAKTKRKVVARKRWGEDFELYRTDVRNVDLGLVEDKFERAVRTLHQDYLQLDQKPRKAVLAVPSLLPTPLLEIALKVLFQQYNQPPSIQILTTPILACVGAGLRNGLVVEVGWEEMVVTAVGEYKEVYQRRSIRAGKMLTQEMAKVLDEEAVRSSTGKGSKVSFQDAEEAAERMGWCRPRPASSDDPATASGTNSKRIPLSGQGTKHVDVPFDKLAEPIESTLFATDVSDLSALDSHEQPIHHLAFNVLLHLPFDLRAICISRIVLTGGLSNLPGLQSRFLYELTRLIEHRGWDSVARYGSAQKWRDNVLKKRNANIAATRQPKPPDEPPSSPTKKDAVSALPPRERPHDDLKDPISNKAERNHGAKPGDGAVKGVVRGVETLGAWAGASLVASLRVKGVHEVEREDFLKHGLRDGGAVY